MTSEVTLSQIFTELQSLRKDFRNIQEYIYTNLPPLQNDSEVHHKEIQLVQQKAQQVNLIKETILDALPDVTVTPIKSPRKPQRKERRCLCDHDKYKSMDMIDSPCLTGSPTIEALVPTVEASTPMAKTISKAISKRLKTKIFDSQKTNNINKDFFKALGGKSDVVLFVETLFFVFGSYHKSLPADRKVLCEDQKAFVFEETCNETYVYKQVDGVKTGAMFGNDDNLFEVKDAFYLTNNSFKIIEKFYQTFSESNKAFKLNSGAFIRVTAWTCDKDV
ncbi:hypothetical protein EIN_023810 [Entamoeba invadens IP1]|uniref:hypothetical protein n=1 Tax=Entamoeba invadens IP1 TaxID=370355 RepID=UPI0002C3D051|nr:hypothetical protein EIN_023810 [Entamoeba invadens IP1]ELP90682.1 hypothetical protein EIN_023810 [Entamoeba invadens IP1]|eukprot:XP_004257453.1 hypothetical protein EIN_023810 [Entamoeba invadens IP1]